MVQCEATATVLAVPRLLSVFVVSFGLGALAGCGSVRDRARDDLVDQLVSDGGLLPGRQLRSTVLRSARHRELEFFEREG